VRTTSLLSTIVLTASAACIGGAAAARPAPHRASGRAPAARSVRDKTVAVIPAQWYRADAESAQRLTEGIDKNFSARGGKLLPEETVRSAATAMGLKDGSLYSDAALIRLGRQVHADLIVYPRLLALGLPAAALHPEPRGVASAAVVHVRVIDVKRRRAVYCNQVAHEFKTEGEAGSDHFALSGPEGQLAAIEVLRGFFTPQSATQASLRAPGARPAPRAVSAPATEPPAPAEGAPVQPEDDEQQ